MLESVQNHSIPAQYRRKEEEKQNSSLQSSIYRCATPIIFTSFNEICNHSIFLSEQTAAAFPYLNNGLSDKYVRIGVRVYRVVIMDGLESCFVGIDSVQFHDAEVQGLFYYFQNEQYLTLQSFCPPLNQHRKISRIIFNVSLNRDLDIPDGNPKIIHAAELQNYIASKIHHTYVGFHQILTVNHPIGHIQLTVKKIHFQENDYYDESLPIGFVNTETDFNFKSLSSSDVKIIERENLDINIKLKFKIDIKASSSSNTGILFPALVDFDTLRKELFTKIINKRIMLGDKFYIDKPVKCTVSLEQTVGENRIDDFMEKSDWSECYVCRTYKQIEFVRHKDLLIKYEKPRLASELVLKIIGFIKFNDTSRKRAIHLRHFPVSEITTIVLNKCLSKKQKFFLNIPQGTLYVGIKRICGFIKGRRLESPTKQTTWEIDHRTDIKVEIAPAIKLFPTDNSIAYPLKSLTVDVSIDSETQQLITDDVLKEAFLFHATKLFVPGDSVVLHLKKYPKIHLKLSDFEYEGIEKSAIKYSSLGIVNHETNIRFKTEMKSVKINSSAKEDNQESFVKRLEKHGVGGLPDDLVKELEDIIFTLENKEKFAKCGISPPRGAIFYGPPGSGKTNLAKALAAMLGLECKLMNGTEILNKYVGVSEENIRGLFEPDGPKIIFIDELDSIAGKRSESGQSKVHKTIVSQLLGNLDGIKKNDKFFIGATNHLEAIDEAVIRSGRFEIQLMLGLPDHKSRKGIFDVQMKVNYRDCAPFSEDIDLELLGSMTEGYSAADIGRIVTIACTDTVSRRIKATNESDPVAMADFEEALRKINFQSAVKRMNQEDEEKIHSYIT